MNSPESPYGFNPHTAKDLEQLRAFNSASIAGITKAITYGKVFILTDDCHMSGGHGEPSITVNAIAQKGDRREQFSGWHPCFISFEDAQSYMSKTPSCRGFRIVELTCISPSR